MSRKVTEQAVNAFIAGNKYSNKNTMTDGETLFLHGHPIAKKVGGSILLSMCGWGTVTTRERLNGVLCGLGIRGAGFYQRGYVQHYDGPCGDDWVEGMEIDPSDTVELKWPYERAVI
jgi:hypothetical protein